jgi:hypothetical protein
MLPLILSEMRDEFDLSASDNLITPSLPILLSVSEWECNEATSKLLLRSSEVSDEFDLSASNNLTAPSVQMLFTVLSK